MKILLVVAFCLLLMSNASAQVAMTDAGNTKVSIEQVTLARNEMNGEVSEPTDKFLTTDNPIYCFIQLNSIKPTTVKLILVAVKAEGLEPQTKSVSVSYTTNGNQNQVNFNASPEDVWAAGIYRADIFINGTLARSQTFTIEKSLKETESQTQAAPKLDLQPKTIKKFRKNTIRRKTERLSDIAAF